MRSFFFLVFFTAAVILGISLAQASQLRLAAIERHVGLHERSDRSAIRQLIGTDPASTPWCGYAVAYAVRKAGGNPVSGYPSARSWLGYGRSVKLSQAKPGDIVVYRFSRGYHVAIFKSRSASGRHISCGGNMSNKFKCSSYRNSSVVGVRR